MPLPIPTTEKPSTSETAQTTSGANDQNVERATNYPASSVPAADISDQESSMGATAGGKIGEGKGSAEEAAERLYEERIEEEYAKREGGA